MRFTHPRGRTRRTARSVGLTAVLAAASATALAAAPAASAASTASLTVTLPGVVIIESAHVYFGSLRIDDGTSVTCISAQEGQISGTLSRVVFGTAYKVTAGHTYGISAWEGAKCHYLDPQWGWTRSLGGVTVTPTAADVSSGVYQVAIR